MRVMCSNDSSLWYMRLCQKYPEQTGWLIGPRYWKKPRANVPFAMDNDAYQSFTTGKPYDFDAWQRFLDKVAATAIEPLWALVPDVVADKDRTLEQWHEYSPVIRERGWKAALAVQDGMSQTEAVDCDADVIFIGGTTHWKRMTARMWCESFPRVHIARIWLRWLDIARRLGAESCDGTGWFRQTTQGKPARQLEAWLEGCNYQHELALK